MTTEQMTDGTALDPWGAVSPWERYAPGFSDDTTRVQEEDSETAEDGPDMPSAEELAEILADIYGATQEEQTEDAPKAIGSNGLVLIDDPDWIDMTARNMDYLRHVYRSDLNHADKTVLGVVALHCGINSRGCIASNETLAEEANIDRDNFRKRLSRLTKEGWVRENGMRPAVRPGMSGAKVRHIGVQRSWLEGGS